MARKTQASKPEVPAARRRATKAAAAPALVTGAVAPEGSPFAAALRETRAMILQRLGRER